MKKRPKRQVYSKAASSAAPSLVKVKGLTKLKSGLNHVVGAIVKEITDQMNLTLQGVGKTFSAGALDEWLPKLKASVSMRVLGGGSWANDRTNVLAVASDMALIASILSGGTSVVNKGRGHPAFPPPNDHPTLRGNQGS